MVLKDNSGRRMMNRYIMIHRYEAHKFRYKSWEYLCCTFDNYHGSLRSYSTYYSTVSEVNGKQFSSHFSMATLINHCAKSFPKENSSL